ncbi:MAG: hypothetical protein HQK97_07695 [Nitrospirae bacterium]|nr:hypothetical protein [Nitrospirota bacterium]
MKAEAGLGAIVTRKLYILSFAAVVLMAVILRIYKAYYTGVIYDEALTYFRFSRSLDSAVSNYSSTNNHVLNSVLIYLSTRGLGQLGSFMWVPAIRLPAVFFGLVYVASISLIIALAIKNRIIKFLLLGACLFNYFLFDLSILARGYALALGAVYLELLLVVLYPTYLRGRDRMMVFLFSGLNFIALGGMLTSFYTIVPVNLAFLAVACHSKINTGLKRPSTLIRAIQTGVAIMCISACALVLLYSRLITKIVSVSGKKSEINNPLSTILTSLTDEGLFLKSQFYHFHPEAIIQLIMLPALAVLAILFILNLLINKKTVTPAAAIIILVLAASFSLAYAARTAGGVSLGFTRNHVFWLPLMFLSVGIITEGALALLEPHIITPLALKACIYVLASVIFFSSIILITGPIASTQVVTTHDWAAQSVVAPLIRQLHKTDPTRHWRLGFSDKLEYNLYPYLFYNAEVYRIIDADIAVYPLSEQALHGGIFYEYDLFKKFDCVVVPVRLGLFHN